MPGYIKVSNSQRSVSSAYSKVSGTWRPVIRSFTKVNGTWRQWFEANIDDNFNRTDASSLGTSSNGIGTWTDVIGTWGITSNVATTATSASSYPLSKVETVSQIADYEVRVDIPTGAGAGVGIWVTDANNWYSVTTKTVGSTVYSCPSGGTLSGTTCYVTATCGGGCSSSYTGPYTNGYSQSYNSTPSTTYTWVAGHCGTQCGTAGFTCIGSNCFSVSTTYSCTGSSGSGPLDCSTYYHGGCFNGGSYYSSDPCGGSGGAGCYSYSTSSPYDCSYTYAATATSNAVYSVQVTKMEAGSASVIHSFTTAFEPRSLKVVTSNNQISMTAYSATGLTGTTTSSTHTATTPLTTKYAGIALAPSTNNQTTSVDNFYLK